MSADKFSQKLLLASLYMSGEGFPLSVYSEFRGDGDYLNGLRKMKKKRGKKHKRKKK